MIDKNKTLSIASGSLRSFRLSTTSSIISTNTISPSELSLSHNGDRSTASSALTTPIEPTFENMFPSSYFKLAPALPDEYKELPQKPLPSPPPREPVNDSDYLELVMQLQSVNRSMKLLNASLGDLAEDMASIETMLITRELLVQDLAGLPGEIDSLEDHSSPPTKYLRKLYQRLAHTSLPYTQ